MSDINTKEIDFERAAQLLRVVHDCAGVGPKLTSLGNAAMTELTKMNDAIKVAAIEAEKERLLQEGRDRVLLDSTADPTEPDPDEDLLGRIQPSSYPQDSQTATIADANIDRRL
jgi:hypothetical protein